MDSVSTILTTLDAAITSAGRQYFEATAGAVGPIYTTLLALLLVMVGINAALNVYRISMRDAVQLSFRIVMVLMFGLTWSNFTQIYDAASNGLSALALEYFRLGGGGVGASATAAMDDMANMMAGNVDFVSSAMSSIMRGFVAAVLYVVLGVLMAVYVFIVGFSKLMIAFLARRCPNRHWCHDLREDQGHVRSLALGNDWLPDVSGRLGWGHRGRGYGSSRRLSRSQTRY